MRAALAPLARRLPAEIGARVSSKRVRRINTILTPRPRDLVAPGEEFFESRKNRDRSDQASKESKGQFELDQIGEPGTIFVSRDDVPMAPRSERAFDQLVLE